MTALYRDISPDVLDETVKLRLDRTIADAGVREGDATLATEYLRRVLDRVPEDNRALAALENIYRGAEDNEALYDILVRRAELAQNDPKAEERFRLQIGALAEAPLGRLDEAIATYERVQRAGARQPRRGRRARPALQQGGALGDVVRLLEEILDTGNLRERDLDRPPLPAGADRAGSSAPIAKRRSTTCGGSSTAIPTTPRRSRCSRGCSTTSRCRAWPPSCSSPSTRGAPTGLR